MADIGFIGLGLMGRGMASNLIAAGHKLWVMAHRDRTALEELLTRGAAEAATPALMAETVDYLFLCVPGSPQVEALVHGTDGILAGARNGLTVIDTSTSLPASTRKLSEVLASRDVTLVDAPVTRGPTEAAAGKLNSLVGANEAKFDEVRLLIATYSETVVRFGDTGAGHTAKLVNNAVTQGTAALLAEAFSVARKAGVDLHALFATMSNGGANSGTLQKMIKPALDGDLTGQQFALGNAFKDLSYFRELTAELGISTPVADAAYQTLLQAVNLGYGDQMVASLLEAYAQCNAVPSWEKN